jgi:hypothetical protein
MNETKASSPVPSSFTSPSTITEQQSPFTQQQEQQRQSFATLDVYLNTERYDQIQEWVKSNIKRRAKQLEDDLQQNVMIENRVVSGRLSSIPGVQRHLSHAKSAKMLYENQAVPDISSHSTLTRADLNRKYHR